MSRLSFHEVKERAKRFGSRLSHEIKGTASIEFVMIAPVLLIFMIGTVEVSRAINVDKRVNSVTSMAGDLISRGGDDMTANPIATMDAIMDVVTHVMHPYDPSTLKMTVIPVMADATDETRTFVYADPYNYNGGVGSAPAANTCYSMPANVMTKGSTAIIVKSEFAYEPLLVGFFDNFGFLGINGGSIEWDDAGVTTYTDESIHSPRQACVDFDNNNCIVATPGGC